MLTGFDPTSAKKWREYCILLRITLCKVDKSNNQLEGRMVNKMADFELPKPLAVKMFLNSSLNCKYDTIQLVNYFPSGLCLSMDPESV